MNDFKPQSKKVLKELSGNTQSPTVMVLEPTPNNIHANSQQDRELHRNERAFITLSGFPKFLWLN